MVKRRHANRNLYKVVIDGNGLYHIITKSMRGNLPMLGKFKAFNYWLTNTSRDVLGYSHREDEDGEDTFPFANYLRDFGIRDFNVHLDFFSCKVGNQKSVFMLENKVACFNAWCETAHWRSLGYSWNDARRMVEFVGNAGIRPMPIHKEDAIEFVSTIEYHKHMYPYRFIGTIWTNSY